MPALKPSLSIARSGAHLQHARYQGCVGHWLFTEGAGAVAYDVAGRGGHATLTNIALDAAWTSGKHGGALLCDGTDAYLTVVHRPAYQLVKDLSIAVWCQRGDTSNNSALLTKVNVAADDVDYEFGIAPAPDTDKLFLYTPGADASFPVVLSTGTVADLLWHHLAVTRVGTVVTFYIDGRLDSTGAMTPDFPVSAGALRLGIDMLADTTAYFFGRFGDVRLYNRGLSTQEIASLYADPYLEFQHRRHWWPHGMAAAGRVSKNTHPWPLGMELGMNIGMPV